MSGNLISRSWSPWSECKIMLKKMIEEIDGAIKIYVVTITGRTQHCHAKAKQQNFVLVLEN